MYHLIALAIILFLAIILLFPVRPVITVEKYAEPRRLEYSDAVRQPPEVEALERLSRSEDWESLIAAGDIYRKGAYPRFAPNNDMAIECFKVAAMCPDGGVAGIAQSKYIEARTEAIDAIDIAGAQLPTRYGQEMCMAAMRRINTTPFQEFIRPLYVREREPEPNVPEVVAEFVVPVNPMRRDAQNVHDHSVMNIAKKNFKSMPLVTSENSTTEQKVIKSIQSNKELSERQKSDALNVLGRLGDAETSGFGVSEKDVLSTVWSKINGEQDATVKRNLIETLGKQLASGVENGVVVCSSGKILRMLGTLDGTDHAPEQLRPVWAVREEMGTLAAGIRSRHVDSLAPESKASYDRGEMPELENNMKAEFNKKVNDLYVDELGMSKAVLGPIIREYEEAF